MRLTCKIMRIINQKSCCIGVRHLVNINHLSLSPYNRIVKHILHLSFNRLIDVYIIVIDHFVYHRHDHRSNEPSTCHI